jgi:Co/Zn/Cd efflux system component
MSDCCNHDCALDALRERQSATLKIVLAINIIMFFAVAVAALYAKSSALLLDSFDNFGDALTYAISLYAVGMGTTTKARVALLKGFLILFAALLVLGQMLYKLAHPSTPIFEAMGLFSLLGLLANGICLYLLWRHREDDINMSSVWACSRNDIASNVAVFLAAIGVWVTNSGWPDLVIATFLVIFLLKSAIQVIASAKTELAISKLTPIK